MKPILFKLVCLVKCLLYWTITSLNFIIDYIVVHVNVLSTPLVFIYCFRMMVALGTLSSFSMILLCYYNLNPFAFALANLAVYCLGCFCCAQYVAGAHDFYILPLLDLNYNIPIPEWVLDGRPKVNEYSLNYLFQDKPLDPTYVGIVDGSIDESLCSHYPTKEETQERRGHYVILSSGIFLFMMYVVSLHA